MIKGFSLDCECGKCEMALLNGYDVGDTLLEDVMFEVRVKDGDMSIKVSDNDAKYFSDFNTKKWLKEVALDAIQADTLECSLCGGDVVVMYDGRPGYEYKNPDKLAKTVKIHDR